MLVCVNALSLAIWLRKALVERINAIVLLCQLLLVFLQILQIGVFVELASFL